MANTPPRARHHDSLLDPKEDESTVSSNNDDINDKNLIETEMSTKRKLMIKEMNRKSKKARKHDNVVSNNSIPSDNSNPTISEINVSTGSNTRVSTLTTSEKLNSLGLMEDPANERVLISKFVKTTF